MELKKALKSLVALGTGATLVGATVLSALAAADLSTYPAPFVAAGAYDALIVVGASAATADVLGSVDIATSLQVANTVDGTCPGSATTTTVEGDAFRIDTGADFLEKGEQLDTVGITTLTSGDLAALTGGSVTNAKGTFNYDETITVASLAVPDYVIDTYDDTNTPAWYMKFSDTENVFTYKVSFTPALESDVDAEHDLDDLDKKSIVMLGKTYTVVDTHCPITTQACRIDFMAGAASDTLSVGETKTYTVGDSDYEVTLTYVDTTYAKFTVNGVATASMQIGETDVLADGTEIGLADRLYQAYAGGVQSAEFYIGATKVRISETALNVGTGASVVVGSNTVTDVTGSMKGTNATVTKIEYIQFTWLADEDIYVKAGTKLSEATNYHDDNQMFLNFDIEYQGIQEDTVQDTIELSGVGDDEYTLSFTNKVGDLVKVPLFNVDTLDLKHGRDNYDLVFKEAGDAGNWSLGTTYVINRNDYFVVSDSSAKKTYLIRYKSYDATDKVMEFEDVGSGGEIKETMSWSDNETAAGDLTLGGHDYSVFMAADLQNTNILMDLDGDAAITLDAIPYWYTKNGAYILVDATPNNGIKVYSEAGDDTVGQSAITDMISVAITNGTADNVDIGTVGGNVTLLGIGDGNNQEDRSVWGTHVYKTYAESGPDKLTITYPDDQTEHLVFYSSGATTSSASTGGTTYETVVAIGVDAAVLDTEVTDFSAQNIIIVGGPCVNLAAADAMGNPSPCTTGFEEGKAMIKLYERTNGNVALLVAGYTAMDTRRAARALGEYGSHTLTGTEMEVAGTSLTQYTVTAVTAD